MWINTEMICLGILVLLSYIDIKKREVPIQMLLAAAAGENLYHIMYREQDIWLLLGGATVGFLFLGISFITRESLGYGDSWGIVILGVYLGLWRLLEVLFGAFFLSGVISAVLLCKKKMSRKSTLPFYPFLTCGYVLVLLSEGGKL